MRGAETFGQQTCTWDEAASVYLINEGQMSLDGGFILFLLELEVPAQLLLGLLHVSGRQLPLLGLSVTTRRM